MKSFICIYFLKLFWKELFPNFFIKVSLLVKSKAAEFFVVCMSLLICVRELVCAGVCEWVCVHVCAYQKTASVFFRYHSSLVFWNSGSHWPGTQRVGLYGWSVNTTEPPVFYFFKKCELCGNWTQILMDAKTNTLPS